MLLSIPSKRESTRRPGRSPLATPRDFGGIKVEHVRLIDRRIQKASKLEGETAFSRLVTVTTDLFKNEGPAALYKGITPRVLRVAPGQAIVFTVSPTPM